MTATNPGRLLVLWTTDVKATAADMVLMYTTNSLRHHWWKEVVLLIWGASQQLVCADADIQALLKVAHEAGVRPIACLACARDLGLVEELQSQGVEVFYTGQFLADWQKSGDALLSI